MNALQTQLKNLSISLEMGNVDINELSNILKSTAFKIKDGAVTDEQMTALTIVANQYKLNPFTKEIYAYPDKQNGIVPVVGVDGWSRIINQNPQFDGVEFNYSDQSIDYPGAKPCPSWVDCTIYRKDRKKPTIIREYLDEVYREPFKGKGNNGSYTVNGPWQTHTKRFLRHKALIQCARIAFGYVGIYDEDEAQRIAESDYKIIDVTPKPSLDDAIVSIASMNPEEFKNFDHTPFDADEKKLLRAAMTKRKSEVKEKSVVAEQPAERDIVAELKNSKTKSELEAIVNTLTDAENLVYDDVIAEMYDYFRE